MNSNLPLYKGAVHDINMEKEWYCPYCRVPLDLNSMGDVLICNANHDDVCDYEHGNKSARDRHSIVWLASYLYPLTKIEAIREKMTDIKQQNQRLRAQIEANNAELEKLKQQAVLQ